MTGRVLVQVLCEGLQDMQFVRRLMIGLGVGRRELAFKVNPKGRMSGEQFVREQYPGVLAEHRIQSAKRRAVLLVLTDADTRTLAATRQRLTDSLAQHELPPRRSNDAVALLIPRRNIETWLHALEGATVDETTAYPKREGRESECQTAVARLLNLLTGDPDAVQPPSLAEAIRELKPLIALIKA
jgi:hypothetical protein